MENRTLSAVKQEHAQKSIESENIPSLHQDIYPLLFSFLSVKDLRTSRLGNKQLKEIAEIEIAKKLLPEKSLNPIFFAVGFNIPLFETKYVLGTTIKPTGTYQTYRSYNAKIKEFDAKTILDSLRKKQEVFIFENFVSAKSYQHKIAGKHYNPSGSFYEDSSRPALFLVSVANLFLIKKTKKIVSNIHHIESYRHTSEEVELLTTQQTNIRKIHFAKFNFSFFNTQELVTNQNALLVKFSNLWDKTIDDAKGQLTLESFRVLFRSYSTFYSVFTRSNQNEVNDILNYLKNPKDPKSLFDFLNGYYIKAKEDNAIKKHGYYFQLLEFSVCKAKEFLDISELKGSNIYLRQ